MWEKTEASRDTFASSISSAMSLGAYTRRRRSHHSARRCRAERLLGLAATMSAISAQSLSVRWAGVVEGAEGSEVEGKVPPGSPRTIVCFLFPALP